jgi:hypothetical protein
MKHQNKWNRFGAAKASALRPARVKNSEPIGFIDLKESFETVLKGIAELFVSR